MEKPIIALTCPGKVNEKKNTKYINCEYFYIKSIEKSGGFPLIVDVSFMPLEKNILDIISGILITGGGDINPETYKERKKAETEGIDNERDLFEIQLAKIAWEKQIPLMGICRGIQVINVAYGGTLYQHLPNHKYNNNHTVKIDKTSILYSAFGKEKLMVNSYHHQAVKKIPSTLKPTAFSPNDGTIEAIESTGNNFIMGIQWHPERMYDKFYPLFNLLIKKANLYKFNHKQRV